MQPNDPYQQQQPQLPSDYLNQIATPTQVKTLNPLVLWGMIVGVLVLAIAVVVGVSSSSAGPSGSSLASVGARLQNLETVSEKAQKNIQSSQLRTLNSNLNLSLTNTNRDLATPLKSQDINLKDKKSSAIKSATSQSEALQKRLEDARLNAVYDRTYAREMLYELRTITSDMAVLYKKSRDKELRETLDTANNNFLPVIERLSGFNET